MVKGISFTLGRERLGIVGESGSGKSMTGRSILRLIRPPGRVTAARLAFDGIDLHGAVGAADAGHPRRPHLDGDAGPEILAQPGDDDRIADRRGAADAPASAAPATSHRRVRAMLEAVRIDDPDRVAKLYPHEVSGGMGQRVMIAMMLIPEPDILIADEPTSALDVSVQRQVLDIIDDLVRRTGMGLIFISHDLNLVSSYCDRILVMRDGAIVEECAAGQLANASHPYTRGPAGGDPAHRRNARRTARPRPPWDGRHERHRHRRSRRLLRRRRGSPTASASASAKAKALRWSAKAAPARPPC